MRCEITALLDAVNQGARGTGSLSQTGGAGALPVLVIIYFSYSF